MAWWTINGIFLGTLLITAFTRSKGMALIGLGLLVGVHVVGLLFG